MKIKKMLVALGLAATAGIGLFAGLNSTKSEIKETKAAGEISIYLDATSTWNHDSAKFAIWAWGDGVSATAFGLSSVKDNLFYVNIDPKYSSFIFLRLSSDQYNNVLQYQYCPSNQGGNVGDYWNKVGDTSRGSYNKLTITSNSTGTWSTLSAPSNATVYFVDGHSWHSSHTVKAHFWGGTATSTFPGSAMSDSNLRIKCYVGETEYSGIRIYKYTISGTAMRILFDNDNNGGQTGDLDVSDGEVYFYGVDANTYSDVADLLIDLQSKMGSATFNGRTFSNSICKLNQTQAKDFVDTYDDLFTNHGSGVSSSVAGSAIVTYSDPKNNNTSTGEITLSSIRTALVEKYPTIVNSNIVLPLQKNNNSSIIITVISTISLVALGGFFFMKKKEESR